MRTIEVYHLIGPERRLISRMWFLNNKDFQDMTIRLSTAAPCNTLRRDRHEACHIRAIYSSTFDIDYHTDGLPSKILNICTEYALFYGCARKIAEAKVWRFAWQYASPQWRHRTILKQMRKASRLLTNSDKSFVYC